MGRRAPRADLEDVLSEVYLVAWRRYDSIAGDPLPWLYGIARRVLANHLRSDRRRGALLDRLRHVRSADPGWTAPDGLRAELAAAIAALSPAEREALLLTAWEDSVPNGARGRPALRVSVSGAAASSASSFQGRACCPKPVASEFFDPQGGVMTTDDPVLKEITDANPVALTTTNAAEAERVLRRVLADDHTNPRTSAAEKGAGRRPWAIALGTLSVLVVAVVVVIAVTVVHHGSSVSTPAAGGRSVTLVYRVQPTVRAPRVTRAAINREVAVIHARLAGEPVHAVVRPLGADEIRLGLSGPHLTNGQLSLIEQRATATGSLVFYDWEADALLPNGNTVASQLPSHDPRALKISQGDETTPPGGTVGSMTLYQAVTVASRQPAATGGSRLGPAYYLFGAPGSEACATVAADRQTRPIGGAHCYLSGPVSDPSLPSLLPPGVQPSDGTWVKVPQGTVVLSGALNQSGVTSSRFFALRDDVALTNADIAHARLGKLAGADAVELRLTKQGAAAFQNLTSEIAHRGQQVSEHQAPVPALRGRARQRPDDGAPDRLREVPRRGRRQPRIPEPRHRERQPAASQAARGHPTSGRAAARTDPNRPWRLIAPDPPFR